MARTYHMINSAGMVGANLVAEELLTGVRAKKTDCRLRWAAHIWKGRTGGP